MPTGDDPRPFLVVTVLVDAAARPAAVTRSHGDAMERAAQVTADTPVSGIDLVELPVGPKAFAALRRNLGMPPTTVALYDLFPLSTALDPSLRTTAGQFLAAEALWAMEEQGLLGGESPAERLRLPSGWSKDPKDIRQKLVDAGATRLSDPAISAFAAIKSRWDASPPIT